MRPAAIFDLDRTLIRINSGTQFIRWSVRRGESPRSELLKMLWWGAQYTLGVLDVETLATRTLRPLIGTREDAFIEKLELFVREEVLAHITAAAKREIESVRARGMPCAILTGATKYSALPVARALGIDDVLCTSIEVVDGLFTGKHLRPICYGSGKVTLAERWARERDVDLAKSVFYSDSISDLPMLERVGIPVVVNADPRLSWIARRRGWRSERWVLIADKAAVKSERNLYIDLRARSNLHRHCVEHREH